MKQFNGAQITNENQDKSGRQLPFCYMSSEVGLYLTRTKQMYGNPSMLFTDQLNTDTWNYEFFCR